ncbi:MAG: hypothetical protein A2508_00770 [Candidatus Lambdaproteobacteria bacterium RIFOXYD12_FULL_49_8]|uniref:Outer membrane protein beta-barrel domain-containing protein n=1 Tax=Candidatus Lambdaproteobacteria bacterium RIFOXYD2_FULL_50_16 TaxID=1817772 RepID=A0A1F6GFS1_9PROT|nr:MAG: hypothetical protein A2508_00770 [Candidatus Lambdaproteobacteria bacterium RIFOXYD12_FULL_49_8]OGG96958.1 MAG: hypothetical protein A2527_02560 [Candidatus Lambdaproteobacteria bacterium RIFOXYD2_FULL_50_16]
MKKILFFGLLLLLMASPAMAQRKQKEPGNKLGVAYFALSGTEYTLQSSTSITTGSEPMVGPAFFYERVFLSRFSAGVKYASGLDRSLDMWIDGNTVSIVEKTVLTSFDFKAYFKDHSSSGLKPYLGVGFGNLVSSSVVTTIAASGNTEGNTSATVPTTTLNLGADYLLEFGAVRFDFGTTTGRRRDLDGHTTYKALYKMDGASFSVGVYSFF